MFSKFNSTGEIFHATEYHFSLHILLVPEFLRAAADCDASVIVWLDYMKFGVVSAAELNNTVDCVAKALGALPNRSCCIAVAPQMSSERRSGLRAEWRLEPLGWQQLKH